MGELILVLIPIPLLCAQFLDDGELVARSARPVNGPTAGSAVSVRTWSSSVDRAERNKLV